MKMAVIPARGGSKRIPHKNIRPFCGKPIIAYSIEASIDSGLFDRVIVSTDDLEIAEISRKHGAEIPFIRPAELADDYAETMPVIRHAIVSMQEQGIYPEYICIILATAPFITPSELKRGWRILQQTDADYAFAVTSYPYPIQRAIRITQTGRVEMLEPENYHKRSQELEVTYHDAGQFYWGKTQSVLEGVQVLSEHAVPVLLPRFQVQDIDTFEDWDRSELMFRVNSELKKHRRECYVTKTS